MVAQAGQPKGWPVSFGPVFSPRLGYHPLERENSGGSTHNQTGVRTMFKYRFAAICRTDKKSHIHHLSTIASSEREARRQFASRFVLVLSARIRVSGVAA